MTDTEAMDSLPSDKIEDIANEMTPENVFDEEPTEGATRLVEALAQRTGIAKHLIWTRVWNDAPGVHGNNIEEDKLRYTNVAQYGGLIPPKGDSPGQ
jgi:hypothetical protein